MQIRYWDYDGMSLTLYRLTPYFDSRTKRPTQPTIWVKISGLTSKFWSLIVFRAIENSIGCFLEVDAMYVKMNS